MLWCYRLVFGCCYVSDSPCETCLPQWTNYSAEAVSKNEAESCTNQTACLSLSTAVVKTRCHLRLNHSHSLSLSLLKWNNGGYGVIWIIKPICISKSRKTHASLSVFEIWLTADEVFSGCHIGSSIWIRLHKCDFQQWFCMLLFQTPAWKVSKSRIILWQKLKSI